MADDLKVLHVFIDGRWSVRDWTEMLDAIDDAYSAFALIHLIGDLAGRRDQVGAEPFSIDMRIARLKEVLLADEPSSVREFVQADPFLLERSLDLYPVPRLEMLAAHYGSEGGWDLLGLGKALESVQKFFANTMDFIARRPERKRQELENLEKAFELGKRAGLSDEELAKMLRSKYRRLGYEIDKALDQKRLPKAPEPKLLPPPRPA